ncbi:MAG: SDR family NAD(P)-dependent oxidoreductase [Halioglobus sp.]|nr:SDR family NAD(P)-dependent oxidoreductase [Halioglobus sp.]
MNTAVVVGVGASDGLGAAIARQFSSRRLHAVIAGRTVERLDQVAAEIKANGSACTAFSADATDTRQMAQLAAFVADIGPPEVVIFNVGNNMPIAFDKLTADDFETFWRVCTFSAFLTAKAFLPVLEIHGGSLLFTGASASMRGRPGFAHFGAAKAALRNFAQALAKDYGPRGVHVGHVVVDGVINGARVRGVLAEYLEHLGEDGALEPDAIAEAYWFLHSQPRNAWTFEIDLRPFKEAW